MTFFRILKHIGIIIAGVILPVGIPLLCTGYISSLFSGNTDTVTSASVVLDEPSGDFVVLINKKYHADQDTLEDWKTFFSSSGEDDELLIIFEDIACSVSGIDSAGIEMAESLRSQLPENQMQVQTEDITLLLSRADHGLFDMILMSKEVAEMYHAETVLTEQVEFFEIKGSNE